MSAGLVIYASEKTTTTLTLTCLKLKDAATGACTVDTKDAHHLVLPQFTY